MIFPRSLAQAVLDAASATAAAVRAEEEAEAAAVEEAALDVELQAAADEAAAFIEAAGSIEMVRGKIGWALENEMNPDKLTELVLESLDFGDALETERMALQSRFEGMLLAQEEERLTSRQVEEAENAAVKKKGLRRLSIAPGNKLSVGGGKKAAGGSPAAAAAARGAGRRLSLAVGGGKKDDMDAQTAMAAVSPLHNLPLLVILWVILSRLLVICRRPRSSTKTPAATHSSRPQGQSQPRTGATTLAAQLAAVAGPPEQRRAAAVGLLEQGGLLGARSHRPLRARRWSVRALMGTLTGR